MDAVQPSPYRRSSFCANGSCVEVASQANGTITIRDSKSSAPEEQRYTPDEWVAFVRGVKAGEFDFGLAIEPSDRYRPWSGRRRTPARRRAR